MTARVRGLIGAAMCLSFAACSIAPGMRMTGSATLPVTSGDAHTPAAELQVPINDIDIDLIKRLRTAAAAGDADRAQALVTTPRPYLLGAGDVLQVTVWDHPELAAAVGAQGQTATRPFDPVPGFLIDDSGDLQFPYAGKLHVAGMTVAQVQQLLVTELSKPGAFKEPKVTVRVASYRAKQIYVDGQVHTPGAIPINDLPMTLYEAVNRAGGFSDNADQSRLVLVRDGVSYPLNLSRMLARGESPTNIVLKSGDLLRVLTRADDGAFVLGEVNRPTTAVPMTSGELTLSDALSQAGSFNSASADAAQVYVIRGSLGATPQIYHLNARSPVAMVLANQFELQPKDIVYVDGSGLVRFGRVLSLLLPAINAGLTAAVVTK
jgi:polysaccharide export outer membrane protein